MEYSAASVKFLLWFVEIRETIRLLKDNDWNKVKEIVYQENVYQQKSLDRVVSEFGCIKRRICAIPDELADYMLDADLNTAKQIALIASMSTDRMLFELVYEVYRQKLQMDEKEFKESDVNMFFDRKKEQSDIVAKWTEATVKKLKQTYTKFLIEAGFLKKIEKNEKVIVKPYVEEELRTILLRNNMEKYLYALTGER